MSVPKSRRSLSSLEFFHNAIILRKNITQLLMRDFGIKNFHRNIKYVGDKEMFSDEDRLIIEGIFGNYGIDGEFLDVYPDWLIDKMRIYIMDILRSLHKNIVKANSIYAVNMNEYIIRRNYQNEAISDCEDLLQEMQYIITIVPVNAEKYMPYVGLIEKEIALLKGWRKSDNKIAARIKENENKDNNKK